MADWKTFQLQLPGKDFLEPVREILETLLIFLEILKAILQTIQMFLIDFGNPLLALLQALIKLIEELFEALKKSGFFMYLDVPIPEYDPELNQLKGGFDGFKTRWKASLFDPKDFNRPQPRGSNRGGFVILMVDADDPWKLIQALLALLSFFGRGFETPRFQAPQNFKVIPVGAEGDPILAVAEIFTAGPIESIQLQWSLPTTQESADPGLGDALMKVWNELVPPSFLIEKSLVNPVSQRINADDLDSPGEGLVEFDLPTRFELDPAGTKLTKKEYLRDDYGEPIVKFTEYIKVGAPTQIMGLLGKFRYLDNDVEVDQEYYYRVRAFTGDLDLDESAKTINWSSSLQKLKSTNDFANNGSRTPTLKWPTTDPTSPVIMGAPTGVIKGRIPVDLGDFDVISVLRALFKTAFSLNFHQPMAEDAQFKEDGYPLNDATLNSEVGKGTLVNMSGVLAGLNWLPVIGLLSELEGVGEIEKDPITDKYPEMPWTNFNVIRMSARNADLVASAMLEADGSVLFAFRDLMQSLPNGVIDVVNLNTLTTLEQVVFQMTATEDYVAREGIQAVQRGAPEAVAAYREGYANVPLRLNVQTAIRFLLNFTLGGTPPDWIAIVPLRDIIPWAGEGIYNLLDIINALLDAFKGILDEINNFIESIIRKIDALEAFIQFLIDMLNFIESLEIGFYLLSVPQVDGPITDWIAKVDEAGGDTPDTGPAGYSAGISLAYVAPNIDAFVKAFTIIFGG